MDFLTLQTPDGSTVSINLAAIDAVIAVSDTAANPAANLMLANGNSIIVAGTHDDVLNELETNVPPADTIDNTLGSAANPDNWQFDPITGKPLPAPGQIADPATADPNSGQIQA